MSGKWNRNDVPKKGWACIDSVPPLVPLTVNDRQRTASDRIPEANASAAVGVANW